MNPFSKLPYELFVHILSFLDHRQSFYQCLTCHPTLYTLFYDNEAFWRDLCINKHINYKHPAMTWRQFVLSGEMNRVCPHLTMGLFNQIRAKQDLVYLLSPAYSQQLKCHSICLHPGCDHIGKEKKGQRGDSLANIFKRERSEWEISFWSDQPSRSFSNLFGPSIHCMLWNLWTIIGWDRNEWKMVCPCMGASDGFNSARRRITPDQSTFKTPASSRSRPI